MEEDIVVNVEFEGRNLTIPNVGNVQVVPANIAWEDFELMMKVYSDQEKISVRYLDDDKDMVTICSDEELREAFKVARQCNNTLNLNVACFSADPVDKEIEQVTVDVQNLAVSMANCAAPEQTAEQTVERSAERAPEEKDKGAEKDAKPKRVAKPKKKLFFLKNEAFNCVLDIQGWDTRPGTAVILWPQKSGRQEELLNQLWYEHADTGTVRSAFNHFCLDVSGSGAGATQFVFGKTSQQWHVAGGRLQHRFNPCWLVVGVAEGEQVRADDAAAGSREQRWAALPYGEEAPAPEPESPVPEKPQEKPRRRRRARDIYAHLAEKIGYAHKVHSESPAAAAAAAPRAASAPRELSMDRDASPQWFAKEMEKLRHELAESVSESVAQRTARQVLSGLQGAVVASLPLSGLPLGGVSAQVQPEEDGHVRYSHDGIICDHCESVVVGPRYKCGNCADYDLCARCEALPGVHDAGHVLLKLRRPAPGAGRDPADGCMRPLLQGLVYPTDSSQAEPTESPETAEVPEAKKEAKALEKLRRKEEKLRSMEKKLKKEEKKLEKELKKREEKLKRRLDGEERPSKKERLDLPQFRTSMRLDAEFVRDESLVDGTHVQPATKLTKKWRMRNTGSHAWPESARLKMMWGNMGPAKAEVPVPGLQVGESGVVSVELVAPAAPGNYQSHWRLTDRGQRFGHRVWCAVVVDEPELLEVPAVVVEEQVVPEEPVMSPEVLEPAVVAVENREETVVKFSAEPDILEGPSFVPIMEDEPAERSEPVAESEPPLKSEPATTQEPAAKPTVKLSLSPAEPEEECMEGQVEEEADEEDGLLAASAASQLAEQPSGATCVIDADLLTAQDILSFEMLDISSERPAPRRSQTATPNNTPLESRDVTPPKSPVPEGIAEEDEEEEEEELEEEEAPLSRSSSSSSVEVVASPSTPPSLSQYVTDHIAKIGLRPVTDADMESLSSLSSDDDLLSSSDDSDFYIVPIPDCFNPNLPASKAASTSIYVMKDETRAADDVMTSPVGAEPLLPTTADCLSPSAPIELRPSNSHVLPASPPPASPPPAPPLPPRPQAQRQEQRQEEVQDLDLDLEQVQDQDQDDDIRDSERFEDAREEESDDDNTSVPLLSADREQDEREDVEEEPEELEREQAAPGQPRDDTPRSAVAGQRLSLSAAIDVASQAATAAISTAKDVFYTLQASNRASPPRQDAAWNPPQQTWTPSEGPEWTPPQSNWSPEEPCESDAVMLQLLEMGFADRATNRRLLEKHNGQVEPVIAELVANTANDWE